MNFKRINNKWQMVCNHPWCRNLLYRTKQGNSHTTICPKCREEEYLELVASGVYTDTKSKEFLKNEHAKKYYYLNRDKINEKYREKYRLKKV